MKKQLFIFAAIVAVVFACSRLQVPAPNGSYTPCYCASNCSNDSLCPYIPRTLDLGPPLFPAGYQATLDSAHQPPFDLFSWQSFVALNWPAGPDGQPLPGPIGKDAQAQRVWESYTDVTSIFGDTSGLPACVQEAMRSGKRVLSATSKGQFVIDPDGGFSESDGNALIDKNLNFVLYEIRVNGEEEQYIRKNGLNTIAGRQQFFQNGGAINLPAGQVSGTGWDGPVGAIEHKTSWRILDTAQGDDLSRYFWREAVVYVAAANSETGQDRCIPVTVGLVGMHIAHKLGGLKVDPWIWSTFEHNDNAPDQMQASAGGVTGPKYSFYDPSCVDCPINQPPIPAPTDGGQLKWAANAPYAAKYANGYDYGPRFGMQYFGTQVLRLFPIFSTTQQINRDWQQKLGGTVWANYQLVGTQWRTPSNGGLPYELDAPILLSNSTQETYFQGKRIASCAFCHAMATVPFVQKPGDTIQKPSDHSFILNRAR